MITEVTPWYHESVSPLLKTQNLEDFAFCLKGLYKSTRIDQLQSMSSLTSKNLKLQGNKKSVYFVPNFLWKRVAKAVFYE